MLTCSLVLLLFICSFGVCTGIKDFIEGAQAIFRVANSAEFSIEEKVMFITLSSVLLLLISFCSSFLFVAGFIFALKLFVGA